MKKNPLRKHIIIPKLKQKHKSYYQVLNYMYNTEFKTVYT